ETGYRLYLRDGDTVDAFEFEQAAQEHGLSDGDFDKLPAGYGANVETVRALCELMAANPGWPDSQIDAVRTTADIYDGYQWRLLLKPAQSTGVVVDNLDVIPTRALTADEQGNLADVAVRLGISSNAALRLRNSRVEPSECIDKTVNRLWFAGILGGKWTLDSAV